MYTFNKHASKMQQLIRKSGKTIGLGLLAAGMLQASPSAFGQDYPYKPVAFTQVQLTDHFWKPKIEVNATVTIPYILQMCKEHGRIDNFLKAAGKEPAGDKLTAYPFDDTDIYKLIEGASYSLQTTPNPLLDRQLDTLIQIIGEAQEPDGYLYTFRTAKVKHPQEWIGQHRWENAEILSHELYNCGHLYEAAVAHYQATGKKTLLDIATKNADLLVKDFGWGKIEKYPGHPVVEMGLAKLYRVTGQKKYLDLAKFFLDVRGPQKDNKGDVYNQSNIKLVNQREAEGHAVRAAYLYSGMADVAALTKDTAYLTAIDAIWNDIIDHKLYITGGIGATGNGEAFGPAYDLPNMTAYAETCAAIANVYFNERMFLLHGDARYIDVLEKTLYNGLLSGVSLDGTHFFYPNPLASLGQHARSAWFDCACCITNISRFMPSMPEYIYAQDKNSLFVNLFAANKASFELAAGKVQLEQITNYPWDGKIQINVTPITAKDFSLHIRIPGWAKGDALPGDLYHFLDINPHPVDLFLNGKNVDYQLVNGYAVINRKWSKGDQISFDLPMPVKKILANPEVKADAGRFAFQRGPIVYCIEGADRKDSSVMHLVIDTAAQVRTSYATHKLGGIEELEIPGYLLKRKDANEGTAVEKSPTQVTAIPYYSWNNRGSDEMEVWIPYDASSSTPLPAPSIASKSKVTGSHVSKLMLRAVNNQVTPEDSKDQSTGNLHWWPAKDQQEWVQYEFDQPYTISSSKVYFFDDGPFGGCRVPASWQLLYKKGDNWIPVENTSGYTTEKDKFNEVHFKPVKTTGLKLQLQLPKDNSSGVLEWSVK
ncbi:glycoside hydrolase family 127 protein [Arachidicoccus rhizosphaerae]|nr:glycoside hydrolase family 127 protein [Arachidicoccus rhizosphaerae]